MRAKKFAVSGREHLRRRRRRSEHIAKPIDTSAFQIDAREQRRGNTLSAIAQQPPSLLRALYIAREQNNPRRLQSRKQGTEPRRHLRAVEANDQELPDRLGAW